MPFIEILKDRNVVVSLDPGVDYRRKALAGSEKVYFDLSDPKSGGDKAMDGPMPVTILTDMARRESDHLVL